MRRFITITFITILSIIFFSFVFNQSVGAKTTCPIECTTRSACEAEGKSCDSNYACPDGGNCCCIGRKPDDGSGGDSVTIPIVGDDWLKEIFGEGGLELNILKPKNFFGIEGTASIWSILAMIFAMIWPILFVAFIASIAIGVIRWISSEGVQVKLESAQKTVRNAVFGFIATVLVFAGVNIATWWLGIGNIFQLAQNLAVCGDVVLYEYKRDHLGNIGDKVDCSCPEGATKWQCVQVE